jgi:hypothetical protein
MASSEVVAKSQKKYFSFKKEIGPKEASMLEKYFLGNFAAALVLRCAFERATIAYFD